MLFGKQLLREAFIYMYFPHSRFIIFYFFICLFPRPPYFSTSFAWFYIFAVHSNMVVFVIAHAVTVHTDSHLGKTQSRLEYSMYIVPCIFIWIIQIHASCQFQEKKQKQANCLRPHNCEWLIVIFAANTANTMRIKARREMKERQKSKSHF